MNRWRDRLDRVDRAVDRVMSELLRIEPMRTGDFAGAQADPDRLAFEVEGVLTIARGETDMGGNAAHLRNARIVTAAATAQIMTVHLPAGAEIRKDDRVIAVDQCLVFKVERPDREHPGRLALVLSIDRGATP